MRFVPTYSKFRRKKTYDKVEGYRVEVSPREPLVQAVRAMAAQGGGIIQLGPFTYNLSGTLNLLTGVSLVGVPGATVLKLSGEGPVVRVFTGARLLDCEIELNRPADEDFYTSDQNPTNKWENSVVHLCEPAFQDRSLLISGLDSNGWQGTKYGAATIMGCAINQKITKTRGIFVSSYGVLGDTGATLGDGYINVRIMNNTIIAQDTRSETGNTQSSVYFYHGKYFGVCTGNICSAGDSGGLLGIIKYDGDGSGSNDNAVCFGGVATGGSFNLVSSNICTYTAAL